jgi:hypothetical protein
MQQSLPTHDADIRPTLQVTGRWTARLSWAALAFSILLLIGMFAALSFYAHPQTDDFGEYDDVRDLGITQTIVKRYHGWTGRYTYVTLEGIAVSRMDLIEDYWVVGIATIAALIFAMFCFVRTVTRGIASTWLAAALTLGLFAVYAAMLATPARAFYWLTGAMTNQLVLIFALLSFALLLRDPTGTTPPKRIAAIVAASLCMSAAIGAYDNTIPMLVGILLGGTALALIARDPRRLQVSIVTVVALISSAIVMLAPGNEARAAHFDNAPLLQAIDYSITNSLKWAVPYVLSPTVLLAMLLFVPTGWRMGRRLREIAGGRPQWMLLVVAMWGLMIVCSWLPAQYVMQGNPPPRTINTTSLFLLIGVFGALAVFCAQVPDTQRRDLHLPQGILTFARFAMAAVLLTQGNGVQAIVQLRAEVGAFDRAMHLRYEVIRQAKARGESRVTIPPLPVQPTLLLPMGKDISANPKDYPNFAASRYWEIASIRMEPGEGENASLPTEQPSNANDL